ncbi:unnamed protein product [Closterium sp. NIES-53]
MMDLVVPTMTTLDNPVPRSQTFVTELQEIREKAADAIRKADITARKYSDLLRREIVMTHGQLVLLGTKNLRLPGSKKLRPRFCGTFRIIQMVTPVTTKLLLPDDWRIHDAFHVSLLCNFVPATTDIACQNSDPKKILGHQIRLNATGHHMDFLVRWTDRTNEDGMWVPSASLEASPLLGVYFARKQVANICQIYHICPRPRIALARTVLFRSPPRRSPPVSVLPSPPESSLTVSSHPITDYYRAARPVVSHVLASLVTDPRASLSSVSALTAAVSDFASTRRLDYATRVVAAPPPRPLSVGGESALGCDVLEDTQFELEFLAVTSPSLCAMLLSLEGDPDALDIPTPRTYRQAVSGKWASLWKAAMDVELASWRSTSTYDDAVPPPRANVVDGMWLFKVKQPKAVL